MEEETKICDKCEACTTDCTMHEGTDATTEETPVVEETPSPEPTA